MTSSSTEARAKARAFLRASVTPDLTKIRTAVENTRADGYVATGAALAATATTDSFKPLPAVNAVIGNDTVSGFWDSWTPGDVEAAALLDDGGFQRLLADAGVTIRGIADTTLDRLGTILADGAAAGLSVDEIAASMGDVLDDPSRAYLIADTELARAQTEASLDSFDQNGISQWQWLASDGACDECASYDGQTFSLDDDAPPAHPGCRCAASPVGEFSSDASDEGDDGE